MTSCPKCGNPMNYVEQQNQWYCDVCQLYQNPVQSNQFIAPPSPPPPYSQTQKKQDPLKIVFVIIVVFAIIMAGLFLIGTNGVADTDGDGVWDVNDDFPNDPNEDTDTDGDGIGDNSDPDIDGDGEPNATDEFPTNPDETTDTDGDGTGDNSDSDIDGDGEPNDSDYFPYDSTQSTFCDKLAEDLLLTIEDFPLGWNNLESDSENETVHQYVKLNNFGLVEQTTVVTT